MATQTRAQPDFDSKMGFDRQPPRPALHGIVADWTQLPAQTKPFRTRWKLWDSSSNRLPTSGGSMDWTYSSKTSGRDRLFIRIEAYQGGQAEALREMSGVGHSSSLLPNPWGPAPESVRLGDFSAVLFPERVGPSSPPKEILWVYYNVFARVRSSTSGAHFDIMPIARAIQSFMEKHVTTDVARYVPNAMGLSAPAGPVHVGEMVTVKLVTDPGAPIADWFISIDERDGLLRGRSSGNRLVALFGAEAPGQATIEALVLDQKTLLSRRLQTTVQILPPQGK